MKNKKVGKSDGFDETEREIRELLENMSPEDFERVAKKFAQMGLSGQVVAVSEDNLEEAGPLMEYIQFHENIKESDYTKLSKKKLEKHIKNLDSPKLDLFEQKKNIMILGHTGELEAFEALKKYLKKAKGELVFWAEQALGECEMFLKSDLLDRPVIEFKEFERNDKRT